MGFLEVENTEATSYRKRYLRAKGEKQKLKIRLRKESSHFVFNPERKMEKQSKKFPEDNMDRAIERESQYGSETERTGDCRVRGHKRDEVQARVSYLQEQEKQLPRAVFGKNWYHQHGSNTFQKKHAVERPRESQGKRSPMILIDLNEKPPQPLFEEGSSIAALHEDPGQLLFGKGTSVAALRAGMDCRKLAGRDLGKRICQSQQQLHEGRTLLFQPGSRIPSLRSRMNFIQPEKPAARDEKVSMEIGLNLHREEERPEVRPKKVEAMKHREEVVDRGVYKEKLDVGLDILCSLAMNEIQRIENGSRPREEVDVMRHREEGADLYGTREEKLNEMTKTDRRIYKEDLNLFYKGSETPPAKRNCEDQCLITSESAASEDEDFVDKDSTILCPKQDREDLGAADMERWKSFTRSTIKKAAAIYNNKPSPIQIAAMVSVCNLPKLEISMRLLKQLLELVATQCSWT